MAHPGSDHRKLAEGHKKLAAGKKLNEVVVISGSLNRTEMLARSVLRHEADDAKWLEELERENTRLKKLGEREAI